MKKMLYSIFLVVFAISFIGVAKCNANDTTEIVMDLTGFSTGAQLDLKSMPVYVITKMEAGPPLGGEKITFPLGQYIIGRDGKLINVTGYSFTKIFKLGLSSYGIKEDGYFIKKITRRATNESQTILYIFDYK